MTFNTSLKNSGFPIGDPGLECMMLKVIDNQTSWHQGQCDNEFGGFICEHDFLEPKLVGCHAHLAEEEASNDKQAVELNRQDSKFRKIEDCRLFCQGKPFFDISFDFNCTCRTKWPTGGNSFWENIVVQATETLS